MAGASVRGALPVFFTTTAFLITLLLTRLSPKSNHSVLSVAVVVVTAGFTMSGVRTGLGISVRAASAVALLASPATSPSKGSMIHRVIPALAASRPARRAPEANEPFHTAHCIFTSPPRSFGFLKLGVGPVQSVVLYLGAARSG